tara:strand:- start:384 stop:1583 length:1200 start_codon:yes stop_codon:yes gene_type:complete
MKKKIIFISSLNYDYRLFDKFNLKNYMDSDKIETELWKIDFNENSIKNISNDIFTESLKQESKISEKIKRISNYFELFKLLKKTDKRCFIFDITFSKNPFFSSITKLFGANLIYHGLSTFPIVEIKNEDIKNKITNISFSNFFYLFYKYIFFINRKILNKIILPKLDIFFYNGNYEKKLSKKISKKSVSLHTRDYEHYLTEEKNKTPKLIQNDYILFLDMGYPVPYDNYFSDEKPVTNEENYKNGMIKFLNSVSNILKKKIIVSLHPNSNRKDFFGFDSYRGKTSHLVKHSSFVIAHDSLSLQFVALWKKPCVIIYNNDMINRFTKKKEIEWFKDIMKLKSINIDNFNNEEISSKIIFYQKNGFNKDNYNYFISEFIKDGEEDETHSISKIIIDKISSF